MRKVMLMLAVLGFVGTAWAASPRVGTWKLNLAQSKIPASWGAVKEQTCVIREVGDQYEIVFTGIGTDGKTTSTKYTEPQEGGTVAVDPAPPKGESGVSTMIGPSEWYVTFLQNGKQFEVAHSVISKDGKSIRVTYKIKDAKGVTNEGAVVYDKQ